MTTAATVRRATSLAAKSEGRLVIQLQCSEHGLSDFILEGRGYYRCRACRAAHVAEHRRKVKRILVDEAGGGCSICGYNRYLGRWSSTIATRRRSASRSVGTDRRCRLTPVREEVEKCALLCSNCHAEVEAGVAQLAATV